MTGGCLLAALVLGACGDDSAVGRAQEEQAEKANAICLEAQDAVGTTLGDEPDKDRDAINAARQKLKALPAPNQDQNEWDLFVREMDNFWLQLLDHSEALVPEVNDRPRAQRALDRARATNEQLKKLADDYGATQCAEGFGRA
jgi:hypothetical protein